jgi:hypothetical protein
MEVTIFAVAVIAYIAFRQWLQHQRRMMVHRERLVAVEKGAPLPAVEQEVQRSNWNVERILLLAGLSWISVGIGAIIVLSALVFGAKIGPSSADNIPPGIQWIGVAPVGIGLSHLIVYLVERRRKR